MGIILIGGPVSVIALLVSKIVFSLKGGGGNVFDISKQKIGKQN